MGVRTSGRTSRSDCRAFKRSARQPVTLVMMRWVARVLATALAAYVGLYALGRRAGSTSAERAASLSGDERVERPQLVTNHAITIDAPPTAVWTWLSQMGWHRGGWYTPAWVDRFLFPNNCPALDHLDKTLVRNLASSSATGRARCRRLEAGRSLEFAAAFSSRAVSDSSRP
jgi:hypothetical protein